MGADTEKMEQELDDLRNRLQEQEARANDLERRLADHEALLTELRGLMNI